MTAYEPGPDLPVTCQETRSSLREHHTVIITLGSDSDLNSTLRNGGEFFTESQSWKGLEKSDDSN